MTLKIDKDIIDQIKTCNFGKKCLEGLDSALCCDVVKVCSTFLVVKPISSFKSCNCSHCHQINKEGVDIHICSCPMRLKLYRKNGM